MKIRFLLYLRYQSRKVKKGTAQHSTMVNGRYKLPENKGLNYIYNTVNLFQYSKQTKGPLRIQCNLTLSARSFGIS